MRKFLTLLAILSVTTWSGCRADREPENENERAEPEGREAEAGAADLEQFGSAEELERYFKEQIRVHNEGYYFYRGGVDEEGAVPAAEPQAGAADGADFGEPGAPDDESFDLFQDDFGAEGEGETATGGEEAPEAADDASFSETTIQEEGVDEADVVKTDGTYLYIMTGQDLRIVRAVPADDLQELSRFELKGSGRDLYLVGDLAVALTSTSEVFYPVGVSIAVAESSDSAEGSGDAATEVAPEPRQEAVEPEPDVDDFVPGVEEPGFVPEPWYRPRPQTQVSIIDVSDRSAPELASQTVFDGSIASSRMIDGMLRLVLVNYPDNYYDILPLGDAEVDQQLDALDLDALLPDYQTTNAAGQTTRGNVVGWDAFYRPADPDGFGVSAVVTLDTNAPDTFQAVAMVAEPGLIYASTQALYVTDTEYYYDFRRVDTDIYKFAFGPDNVSLVGAATVPGRILNQYSMGEYQGYLRVATTTDELFDWDTGQSLPSSNNVYVLGEDQGQLGVVGSVEGLAKGEDIKSARFIGPRGYLVTFEQMDPLFTLDLRDPEHPQVVGEWHGPGFSTFIVPMDETHLLTVGVYVDLDAGWARNDGVQLSIFDVTNFASPQQTHNVVIGDSGTSSEATGDPKAFTYFAAEGLVALPIEHWGYREWAIEEGEFDDVDVALAGAEEAEEAAPGAGPRQTSTPPFEDSEEFHGLFVYAVSAEEGFDYLGRVSTALDEQSYWWVSFTRGVFIEEHVYAVTDRAVVSAALDDVDAPASALELFYEYEGNDVVVPPGIPEPEPMPAVAGDAGQSEGSTSDAG